MLHKNSRKPLEAEYYQASKGIVFW
uniref:Uncharacterized protein n=1 Tax=Anopheles quadriannulatus TaxID=34691 RepID=A0A182XSH2_ANOQN